MRGIRWSKIRTLLRRGGFWRNLSAELRIDSHPFRIMSWIRGFEPSLRPSELGYLYRKGRASTEAGIVLAGASLDEYVLLREIPIVGVDPTFPSDMPRVRIAFNVNYIDPETGETKVFKMFRNFEDSPTRQQFDDAVREWRMKVISGDTLPSVFGDDPVLGDVQIDYMMRRF